MACSTIVCFITWKRTSFFKTASQTWSPLIATGARLFLCPCIFGSKRIQSKLVFSPIIEHTHPLPFTFFFFLSLDYALSCFGSLSKMIYHYLYMPKKRLHIPGHTLAASFWILPLTFNYIHKFSRISNKMFVIDWVPCIDIDRVEDKFNRQRRIFIKKHWIV